ncbi:MAG: hypothetical protein Q9P01_09685 [Anaerolineae bacterium]|nr:hypothetical protein [Anaerolineae bacterium]
MRTSRWRDFAFAGLFGSLAIYTYPAAFFYPPALIILSLSLAILRFRDWRIWLPQMAVAGLVAALVMIPLIYLYLTNPEAILARAQDVASGQSRDWKRIFDLLIQQFLSRGDENPQYNVVLSPIVQPIFYLGLIALIARILKPSSWFIAAMLVLFTIPVLASNEITHGLRISSEYIVVPVIVGLGIGTLLHLMPTLRFSLLKWSFPIVLIAFLVILLYGSTVAWQSYRDYWENPAKWQLWRIFGEELDHNEWFFRTDRRYFAEWIVAQDVPMLIPVEEVNRQTTRTWLLRDYPVAFIHC